MTNSSYQTDSSIPLAAVMAGFVVFMPISQCVEPTMPAPNQMGIPEICPTYVLGNTAMTIHIGAVITGDSVVDNYQPRTELGRKLLALRRAYVIAGGLLLDGDALDAEVQLRRGGIADA
jgi:hypothetical protein